MSTPPWHRIQHMVDQIRSSRYGLGVLQADDINLLSVSLHTLVHTDDILGIIRLRHMFAELLERDSAWGIDVLRRIDDAAIDAARRTNNIELLAPLLMSRAHNLHREGRHDDALATYQASAQCFMQVDNAERALRATFMSSLCVRALQQYDDATHIVVHVLAQLPHTSPWYDEPVLMQGRLAQDKGALAAALMHMRTALAYARQSPEPWAVIRSAGILADIGEIHTLQRNYALAGEAFAESISILRQFSGQYNRILARTLVKFAELHTQQYQWDNALEMLHQADDLISRYGAYYDMLWRIELLRCYVYIFQFRWWSALRKLRLVWYYRSFLHQSMGLFVWSVMVRMYRKFMRVKK
jgi:tetratricopeptide (TPR) repeat protein